MACPDWWQDPARTEHYECHWGPYTVQFLACSGFRDPGRSLGNTDETIETKPDGTVVVVPTTDIVDTAPTDPDGIPDITTPPAPGDDGPDSPDKKKCYPSGWGVLNPFEWVLKPTSCALDWAFKPTVPLGVGAGATLILKGGVLGSVGRLATGVNELDFSGTCGVIMSAEVPILGASNALVVDTCAPFWAGAHTIRDLIGIAFIIAGTFAALRTVLRAVGLVVAPDSQGPSGGNTGGGGSIDIGNVSQVPSSGTGLVIR